MIHYDPSSVSESSTTFSGLPHVTDPQPHNEMHVELFYLHFHPLVVQVCKYIAITLYKLKRQVLTAKAFVSIYCCRGHAPIYNFREPCVPETKLWHSAIQLCDNGSTYLELQCIGCRWKSVCVFSLIEQKYSHLVNMFDLGYWFKIFCRQTSQHC